jgi:hypothetical protein
MLKTFYRHEGFVNIIIQYTRIRMFSIDKRTSLLSRHVNYTAKKFYTIGHQELSYGQLWQCQGINVFKCFSSSPTLEQNKLEQARSKVETANESETRCLCSSNTCPIFNELLA